MTKRLLTIGAFISLLWLNISLAADWNLRDHIPFDELTVQSHRGAGMTAPENSLQTFEMAWNWGTIPEADIRMTKDGVIVAFHDNNFKRILPNAPEEMQKKRVQDLTFEELRKIDIGAFRGENFAGQKIPSVAEIVEQLKADPKRRVYLDVKDQVDLAQLAEETKDVHPRLILASTQYNVLQDWKKVAPTAQTLHWMGGTQEKLQQRLDDLEKVKFADIDQLQIHVRIAEDGTLSPSEAFLKKQGEVLRKYGVLYQVFPWESQDPKVFWKMMDLGVASFTTDYPEPTMKAIREYYDQKEKK